MVGDQLTHRGAGCQQERASCFRRARARQRFRLVFDVGEAACNLSERLFNSNSNRPSRELRAGICEGNLVPKGAQPAVGMPKMLFQNNDGPNERMKNIQLVLEREWIF